MTLLAALGELLAALGPLLLALGALLAALGLLLLVLQELLAALGPLLGPKSVVLASFRGVWAGPGQLSTGLGRASGRKVAQTQAPGRLQFERVRVALRAVLRSPRGNFSGGCCFRKTLAKNLTGNLANWQKKRGRRLAAY